MTSVGTLTVTDGIACIEIDSPPVNALGIAVRTALWERFAEAAADPQVRAIVLACAGRTFFAGADITEFGKPMAEPGLPDLCDRIENVGKPVVAAIHGTALGGGLEVALVCSHRIAAPSAKMGLPEVHLGLLPGAGGTQRLPRLVGVEAALDLIVSGRHVPAAQALEIGLIDAIAHEGQLREDAFALARRLVDAGAPIVRMRDRQEKIVAARAHPATFAEFRKANARAFRGFKAPGAIVEAVETAVTLPFDEGMAHERALFVELMHTSESAAQRYYFFAERETAKIPDVPASTPTLPVAKVGVIGAGTMGGGITMNFVSAGIPVTLVETTQEALDRGLGVIRRNYETSAKKGRLTQAEVEARMARITPVLSMDALADVDLVIEAAYESMDLKKEIFGKLDRIVRAGAILASNTSYLDIDAIAAQTQRPEYVMGLHFFSPANVMRLLEAVRGAATKPELVATAMKLARTIGKVPVLSRVCYGFIANRLMTVRGVQAEALMLEGPSPQEIDKALYDYGFAMGPFRMADLVGLDVIGRDSTERSVRGELVAQDRLGQKKNGGFYDYDADRNATPSPIAARAIADFAAFKGVTPGAPQTPAAIVARLLYPVVNEGAKLLEEGIAIRASDIDVAAILGYNWPVYTGGPMFWADTVGLPLIVETLRAFEASHGAAFAPAKLLVEKAGTGGSFTRG